MAHTYFLLGIYPVTGSLLTAFQTLLLTLTAHVASVMPVKLGEVEWFGPGHTVNKPTAATGARLSSSKPMLSACPARAPQHAGS